MNLQEKVLDRLAENMQRSFDFVILCDVLSGVGWTVLEIEYDPDAGQAWHTVKNWVDDNFAGDHKEHNGKWLIELARDATMFSLKWRVKQ